MASVQDEAMILSGEPSGSLALVARQPIYDAALTVVAYELLYRRAPDATTAEISDPQQATLQVISNAVLEIGLDRLAGGLPVHINFPRQLLLDELLLPLKPERIVIEVLEDVPGDPQVLEGIRRLRARGHRIALDDYSPRSCAPELLDVADIVKVDIARDSDEEVRFTVKEAKRRGLQLIAEEVETVEQFEHCLALGFDGFQGYFLQEPQTFRAQRAPSSRFGMLRLVAALQSDDYALDDVEQLVAQDVATSYRLLRCINSSYYNLPRKVESIRQGIVILGLERLRQLCTVVSLLGFDDRPTSLLVGAMIRARMCQQLGKLAGVRDVGPYFLTGLFSMLGALLRQPMTEITEELPLAESITKALTAEEGDLGAALRCTRAYERGRWDQVSYRDLTPAVIRAAYLEAVFWAEETRALITVERHPSAAGSPPPG